MLRKKIILYLFFVLSISSVFAQEQDSLILTKVDIPPLFEGCDDPLISEEQRQACSVPKIAAFINQNITYPDSARVRNIEGVVVVRFSVTKEGEITSLELLRDIGAGCGQEALRVVRMMPAFRPALRGGKAVATKMTLPIRFKKIDEAKADNKNLYQIHWGTAYSNEIKKEELMALLKHHLFIRDYYGNVYDIGFLNLLIQHKNKEHSYESTGNNLSKEMLKALKKAKPNDVLELSATIEKDYKKIEILRTIKITK